MKRVLALLLAGLLLASCGVPLQYKKDYRKVTDYREQIDLVRQNFPEIYRLYENGVVIITDVFEYTDRQTGTPKVHISYHYR